MGEMGGMRQTNGKAGNLWEERESENSWRDEVKLMGVMGWTDGNGGKPEAGTLMGLKYPLIVQY